MGLLLVGLVGVQKDFGETMVVVHRQTIINLNIMWNYD